MVRIQIIIVFLFGLLGISCTKDKDSPYIKLETFVVNQTNELVSVTVFNKSIINRTTTSPDMIISKFEINPGQETYQSYFGENTAGQLVSLFPFDGDSVVIRFGLKRQISFVCNSRLCDVSQSYNPLNQANFSILSSNINGRKKKFYITEAMYAAAKDL